MSNPIYFAPYQVPLVEPSNGLMSRPWYLFFQALFNRVGGSSGPSNDDLEQLATENLDISTVDAAGTAAQIQSAQMSALDADLSDVPSRQDVADALTLVMAALDQADAAQSGFANPTAKVGTVAVNGTAQTAMRSDAAPPLDQAIPAIWTGNHSFRGTGVTTFTDLANYTLTIGKRVAGAGPLLLGTAGSNLALGANNAECVVISTTGTVSSVGPLGVNGAVPPAQVTGFGTPTGAAVVANFPGATATLVQCSNAIAKLITDLKALGLYGA